MTAQTDINIREAGINDVPQIVALLRMLPDLDDLSGYVETYEARLLEHGFGPQSCLGVLLAELDGNAVGFLRYTVRKSVSAGLVFANLDDLVVAESSTRSGIGQALMQRFAAVAPCRGWLGDADDDQQ
jgi:N-acetylglutamate synthase-like GNAT family acetyltransferase